VTTVEIERPATWPERPLLGLCDRGRLDECSGKVYAPLRGMNAYREPRKEWGKPCRNSTTLDALADRGLVELRLRWGSLELEGRIH
jgi:hypothetical protein